MQDTEDIIFLTIDCWREDSMNYMPNLTDITPDWQSGSVMCASPHTGGAFPALFCSSYYPEVYTEDGTVQDEVMSLPQLLSEHGYSTAGFVASNPVTARWSTHFNTWWNDGMAALDAEDSEAGGKRSKIKKAWDFLTLQPHVSAGDVFARADDWWMKTDSPRFLWVHLMEPHAPYLPGFRRGIKTGPFKTYRSLYANATHEDNDNYHGTFPKWVQQHLRTLYKECVREMDVTLANWVKSHHDEATIILTGDHGEEFSHGIITHARLYDETVKVPLLTNRDIEIPDSGLVRQIDIGPSIIETLGISPPDGWEGAPAIEDDQTQLMIGSLERYNQFWLGVRSEHWKVIRPYNSDTGFGETEVYNLDEDPDELHTLPDAAAPDDLTAVLDAFIERKAIQEEITEQHGFVGGVDSSVEGRLQELGYTE